MIHGGKLTIYYREHWHQLVGVKNPYLYRGYRYDTETGLFYVGSRYYDPQTGRFINADDTDVLEVDQDSLIENNLFAYCLNNPANMTDDTGEIAWFVAAAIGGALFDSAMYCIGAAISGNFSWSGLGKAALIGAVSGVCFGAAGKVLKAVKATKNVVYISKNAKGVVQYVGITNNFARRAAEHLTKKGIKVEKFITKLNRSDARAVEQCLIEYYGLMKNGGSLINKINSIAKTNKIYAQALKRGWEILRKNGFRG